MQLARKAQTYTIDECVVVKTGMRCGNAEEEEDGGLGG